jgi:8-amino-7-oxononanoate synthase
MRPTDFHLENASGTPVLQAEPEASSLEAFASEGLSQLADAGLYRTLRTVELRAGATVVIDGRTVVDFSSNDYLGLASDRRVIGAAIRALQCNPGGSGASRLISGNFALHETLERKLAEFKRAPAALLFGSGYLANLGCIAALVGRGDALYCDALNHASLIDAARLSRAEVRVFTHLDLDDLDAKLSADAGRFKHRLIVVDSVFSMDGDLFPLADLVTLARRHDAWTYVDDAHGTAVLGETGRGACEHFGVENEIDVVMGTLGKALGTVGAFAIGGAATIDLLRNRARTFVFTTANPPAIAAAAIEALHIVESDLSLRNRLLENSNRLWAGLSRTVNANYLPRARAGAHHIVPVIVGDARRTVSLGQWLFERGFLVGAIRPPTVPEGSSRLRITISASHTHEQIDELVSVVSEELES